MGSCSKRFIDLIPEQIPKAKGSYIEDSKPREVQWVKSTKRSYMEDDGPETRPGVTSLKEAGGKVIKTSRVMHFIGKATHFVKERESFAIKKNTPRGKASRGSKDTTGQEGSLKGLP